MPIQGLLFDLGGVIIDVDFHRVFRHWARSAACSTESIARRFVENDAYRRHERGQIAPEQFFASLRESLDIDLNDEALREGWNDIYVGLVPGMVELVARLASRLPCFVFTNTNATHQVEWLRRFGDALRPFDKIFVSSELGLRKPEVAAFLAVVEAIDLPAAEILFIDDTPEHVAGARRAGLQALHFQDTASLERALRERQVDTGTQPASVASPTQDGE